jgi:hypothetical protein
VCDTMLFIALFSIVFVVTITSSSNNVLSNNGPRPQDDRGYRQIIIVVIIIIWTSLDLCSSLFLALPHCAFPPGLTRRPRGHPLYFVMGLVNCMFSYKPWGGGGSLVCKVGIII